MTRTVTERIQVNADYDLDVIVTTSDGLEFKYCLGLNDVDSSIKTFETQLATARKQAYDRRVWLNKRKSLTLDEINQLLNKE